MFTQNIAVIFEKGIQISSLLQSKVFVVTFDHDDWPTNHYNEDKCIKPYNGSIFNLRFNYKNIYYEDHFRPMEELDSKEFDSTKIKKVVYTINLLQQSGLYIQDGEKVNEEVSLMQLCAETDELEIFETDALKDIIDYKWNCYGRRHHMLGMATHMLYTAMINIYVS
jgi:hypothetical protein